ncbi:sulfotransferase domain-containing protein [Lichenicoccus sp.]|uniref:sulfotransferase domain-containing protein n=1 Tax=Lichenicoccus sp. TaxID=2781899 RepID=UPI003D108754
MLTDDDIINSYTWLLGRTPSAGEVATNRALYTKHADLQRALMISAEARALRIALHKQGRTIPVELNQPRLVFMHIEKCGGTTLHAMLVSQFAPELICPERHETIGDWTINELADYQLFSGHFDLSYCHLLPGTLRMITMLREPKSRLLSLYHFWKAHRPHPERDAYRLITLARASTAAEFFADPEVTAWASIRNAMTGQLTRTTNRLLRPCDPIVADPEATLARAWQALQNFTSFGIVERFEASRLLLNRTLGLDMQPTNPRQVLRDLMRDNEALASIEPDPPSEALDAALEPLINLDRRLYAMALTLFEKRTAPAKTKPTRKARALPWTRWRHRPQT